MIRITPSRLRWHKLQRFVREEAAPLARRSGPAPVLGLTVAVAAVAAWLVCLQAQATGSVWAASFVPVVLGAANAAAQTAAGRLSAQAIGAGRLSSEARVFGVAACLPALAGFLLCLPDILLYLAPFTPPLRAALWLELMLVPPLLTWVGWRLGQHPARPRAGSVRPATARPALPHPPSPPPWRPPQAPVPVPVPAPAPRPRPSGFFRRGRVLRVSTLASRCTCGLCTRPIEANQLVTTCSHDNEHRVHASCYGHLGVQCPRCMRPLRPPGG